MILKEAIITCHYRQVRLTNITYERALRAAYNLAVPYKVNAGLTSVDPEGNHIVKVVSPDGRIEDVVNGGIEQYEKQRDGHKRTS